MNRVDYPYLTELTLSRSPRCGYSPGEVRRALDEIDRLRTIVDRATRYVTDTDDLFEMAKRGSQLFGKRWQDVIGFKPTSVTP